MVILGLILDSDALKILFSSGIVGVIFFLGLFVVSLKVFWKYIKEYIILAIFLLFFLGHFVIFLWFFMFCIMPPVIDSWFIVEQTKEYKVEVVKKEFKKGKEGESVSYDKRGRRKSVHKYKMDDQYNLHLKKWYQSSDDKENIIIDVPKEKFDTYKEKQLVSLKSYKGFLGFRHIVIEDNALKPVEDSSTETNEQSSTNEN